jgi:hypothetical protein
MKCEGRRVNVKGKSMKMNFRFSLLPFAFSLVVSGCATSAMKNGVAQARYEIQKAIASPALQCGGNEAPPVSVGRLERADTVLAAWQKAYGSEARQIDDNSFYPVLEQMEHESKAISAFNSIISTTIGSWYGILFGTGGAGTLLVSLLVRLLQERGRRKEMETAAGDCASAIEAIKDETARQEAKEAVRKRQTSRTKFHKLIQQIPPSTENS